MSRWKKEEPEFLVSVSNDDKDSEIVRATKLILDKSGNPNR